MLGCSLVIEECGIRHNELAIDDREPAPCIMRQRKRHSVVFGVQANERAEVGSVDGLFRDVKVRTLDRR